MPGVPLSPTDAAPSAMPPHLFLLQLHSAATYPRLAVLTYAFLQVAEKVGHSLCTTSNLKGCKAQVLQGNLGFGILHVVEPLQQGVI